MELRDKCSICQFSMLRKHVYRVSLCSHLFHEACILNLFSDEDHPLCPICRQQIVDSTKIERKHYKKYSLTDRQRLVECANRGDDWASLAKTLAINYKTAFQWIRSGETASKKRGSKKPKSLTTETVDLICCWLEENNSMTLKQIKDKLLADLNIYISVSTIGNYLDGRLYTLKKVHHMPSTMNSEANKLLRKEYVNKLNDFIQAGYDVVWIDETNFNLFCRRNFGRSKVGNRAVQTLPASRGPNIHLIGAISMTGEAKIKKSDVKELSFLTGVIKMTTRRGSFNSQEANTWMKALFEEWIAQGKRLNDLLVVVDNAPCHARLEDVFLNCPARLLRLGPYSPMLNPIETIWSKIKNHVKSHLQVPSVAPPGVGEQRIQYLLNAINSAIATITAIDCGRAVHHATTHQAAVLAMEDVNVGH